MQYQRAAGIQCAFAIAIKRPAVQRFGGTNRIGEIEINKIESRARFTHKHLTILDANLDARIVERIVMHTLKMSFCHCDHASIEFDQHRALDA